MGLVAKNLILLHGNSKGADQPVHNPSQLSAFVTGYLENTVSKHSTCKTVVFQLVSVAGQVALSLTLWQALKTGVHN